MAYSRQLAEVAAQQGQVVAVVDAAHPPQLLRGGLVVEVADQRIAAVGGDGGQTAGVQQRRRLLEQARLGVVGVQLEEQGHARIVRAGRGPCVASPLHPWSAR
jgi:hypothetical protein